MDFCLDALEASFQYRQRQIFNSDQGSQFTATAFTEALPGKGIEISMDNRGKSQTRDYVYYMLLIAEKNYGQALINTLPTIPVNDHINPWIIVLLPGFTFRRCRESAILVRSFSILFLTSYCPNNGVTPQYRLTYNITEDYLYQEGSERGLEEGVARGKKELIIEMLKDGTLTLGKIASLAKVSVDYVRQVTKEFKTSRVAGGFENNVRLRLTLNFYININRTSGT